jgi:2-hydroxycyclohexanecarboxyl-CoA dehydrogenase
MSHADQFQRASEADELAAARLQCVEQERYTPPPEDRVSNWRRTTNVDLGLKGRCAVVTGGASGIGRATAELLLAEGARVALLDRAANCDAVAVELSGKDSGRSRGWSVDITDAGSVDSAAREVEQTLGAVDAVIHCAAIGSGKFGFPFDNLSPADWGRVLEVNILGMVHVAHAFAPQMRERRQGVLLFISSVAGQIGSQTDPPYSASKAANINFAQCLAKDLAPHGVRVNTVCPGMVQTPLNRNVWQGWHDQQPPEKRLTYEEWAGAKVRQVVPLGRWQTPADVANMLVFLASDRAANVTGQTINVDGGFVMHW